MATWSQMNLNIEWGTTTPSSGYILKAYLPGTTTSTSIAIDNVGASPQASLTTNSEGKFEVSGNEVLPYIDRSCKWALFANSTDADANSNPFAGFFDNVPTVSSGDGNHFPGNDPDLADTEAAIIIGSSTPDTNQHIEIGPTIIQSKSDDTTAAVLEINKLGGQVNFGSGTVGFNATIGNSSLDNYVELGASGLIVLSGGFNSFSVVNTTTSISHPDGVFNTLYRALCTVDLFSTTATVTGTTHTTDDDDVGVYTRFTNASLVTITVDDSSITGLSVDDEIQYRFAGSAGGSITVGGSININGGTSAIPVAQHKTVALKYVSANNFDYVGP